MIQQLLQQEILKGLGKQQSRMHSPSLLPVCRVYSYVWKLMAWHCWIMIFLHKIRCGTSRSRTCSTGYSTIVGSASPSSTSSMFISCPVSEDPKCHFGLTYKARDSCFETQLQHIHSLGSKLLLSQTASIPIPFSIPACVWAVFEAPGVVGCPQVAVSFHISSVSRLIHCCIYNYQEKR